MRKIVTLILLVLYASVDANDGLYMQTGLGVSNPIIQPEYRPDNTSETSNNYAAQLTLGYQFKNNIVVEGGVIYHGAVDFLGSSDHSSINEYALLAGYSFDISERWNLIPKVGYSRWKLDSTEGWILNPGDEAQKTTSGSDFTYMLTATYEAFFMTYQGTNFDFGRGRALIFGTNINF